MRYLGRIAVLLVIVAGAGLLFFVGLFIVGLAGISDTARYRVATDVVLDDGSARLTSRTYSDCKVAIVKGGIAPGWHGQRRGEDNHFVLHNGSLLVVRTLLPCRWANPLPPVGTSLALHPNDPEADRTKQGKGVFYRAQALWFDNVHDPRRMRIYDVPALFGLGADGLDIRSATTTRVGGWEGGWSVPRSLERDFPWYRDAPREVTPDGKNGMFHGYRVEVRKLTGGVRCAGPAPASEGPLQIDKCVHATPCRGDRIHDCERPLGWLVADVAPDFRSISFSADRVSYGRMATLYREADILGHDAPGRVAVRRFYWQPRFCLDGLCVDLTTVKGFQFLHFYYPARNLLVNAYPMDENGGYFTALGNKYRYE